MNIEIHTEVWMFSGIVQEVGTIKTLNQKNIMNYLKNNILSPILTNKCFKI